MILSIVNQKGGVGKTTSSVNLSAALAKRGKKVLLIDSDPQGNASSGYGVDKNSLEKTIYDLYSGSLSIEEIMVKDIRDHLDLCPANVQLVGAEVELVDVVSRETILKQELDRIRDQYDFIIIDCPPSLNILTLNALTASDGVIIPIQAEYYALEGLTQLLETIQRVNYQLNPDLSIFGVLITMFDTRTQLAKQVAQEVKKFFKQKVFTTIIPRNVRLSEAPSYGQPINEYDQYSRGARSYLTLAREVIKRAEESEVER